MGDPLATNSVIRNADISLNQRLDSVAAVRSSPQLCEVGRPVIQSDASLLNAVERPKPDLSLTQRKTFLNGLLEQKLVPVYGSDLGGQKLVPIYESDLGEQKRNNEYIKIWWWTKSQSEKNWLLSEYNKNPQYGNFLNFFVNGVDFDTNTGKYVLSKNVLNQNSLVRGNKEGGIPNQPLVRPLQILDKNIKDNDLFDV